MGFRDFLDRLFEPSFDNVKFVTHYQPALKYKAKASQVYYYDFTIHEETLLGEQLMENTYELTITLEYRYKANNLYHFDVKVSNVTFNLNERLKQQEKFLENLSKLTEDISIKINENGFIETFDYPKILKKWETLKPQLLKSYRGKQVESYVEGIDRRIKDQTLFLKRLRDPRFYGLLFDGLQALHEKSNSRQRKVSRLIHTFPVVFDEHIVSVEDTTNERHFSFEGSMPNFNQQTKGRMHEYLNYFEVGETLPFLVYYKKDAVINLDNGFLKKSNLELELSNGNGYTRRQFFKLKQRNNG